MEYNNNKFRSEKEFYERLDTTILPVASVAAMMSSFEGLSLKTSRSLL